MRKGERKGALVKPRQSVSRYPTPRLPLPLAGLFGSKLRDEIQRAMTLTERTLLETLDHLLGQSSVPSAVEAAAARVRRDLHRCSDAVMAWEPLPASLFGTGLPPGVQSAWVSILRAGQTPARSVTPIVIKG